MHPLENLAHKGLIFNVYHQDRISSHYDGIFQCIMTWCYDYEPSVLWVQNYTITLLKKVWYELFGICNVLRELDNVIFSVYCTNLIIVPSGL